MSILYRVTTCVAVVASVAMFTVSPVRAQVVYLDVNAFNAAATTTNTYPLQGIAPVGSVVVDPDVSPLQLVSVGGGYKNAYSATYQNGAFSLNGLDTVGGGRMNSAANLVVVLGQTVSAFGTDIGFRATNGSGEVTVPFIIRPLRGGVEIRGVTSGPISSTGFVGLTYAPGFDGMLISFNTPTATVVLNNVRLGDVGNAPASAPESSPLALVLLGLAILANLIRHYESTNR